MAVDRRDANLKMLNEASDVQNKTKDAIWRIQKQAAEAEDLGGKTLEELRRQGQQMVSFMLLNCYCINSYSLCLIRTTLTPSLNP